MRRFLLLVFGFGLATGAAFGQIEPILKNPVGNVSITQRLGAQVPLDATFQDESGKTVTLGSFFDGKKPVVMMPVYYRCKQACAVELDQMVQSVAELQQQKVMLIGKDFTVVCISIDPQETPQIASDRKADVLAELRDCPTAGDGWHFLTGSVAQLDPVVTALGFRYGYDAKSDRIDHSAGIMVLTPQGKISQYFYGATFEPRPLRDALALADEAKIGRKAQVFLFGCVVMDPVTHHLSANIMAITRLAGVLFVLGIGAAMLQMNLTARRREQRILGGLNEKLL